MATNKEFQVSVIKKLLKQKGIEPDLIDVGSMVDSSLSLAENARIITEDVKVMINTGEIKQETASVRKIDNFLKAARSYERRSLRKKMIDNRKRARHTFEKSELTDKNFSKWENNPNRYDIQGIDSKYL